jgi:hypothetical protein
LQKFKPAGAAAENFFLFGPRATGKSILVKQQLKTVVDELSFCRFTHGHEVGFLVGTERNCSKSELENLPAFQGWIFTSPAVLIRVLSALCKRGCRLFDKLFGIFCGSYACSCLVNKGSPE